MPTTASATAVTPSLTWPPNTETLAFFLKEKKKDFHVCWLDPFSNNWVVNILTLHHPINIKLTPAPTLNCNLSQEGMKLLPNDAPKWILVYRA